MLIKQLIDCNSNQLLAILGQSIDYDKVPSMTTSPQGSNIPAGIVRVSNGDQPSQVSKSEWSGLAPSERGKLVVDKLVWAIEKAPAPVLVLDDSGAVSVTMSKEEELLPRMQGTTHNVLKKLYRSMLNNPIESVLTTAAVEVAAGIIGALLGIPFVLEKGITGFHCLVLLYGREHCETESREDP